LRAAASPVDGVTDAFVVGDIGPTTDWASALRGVDAVIHAAGRAHLLAGGARQASAYYQTNTLGTRCLVSAAARAGVQRFIYLSSVKVNGEATDARPFSAQDVPQPRDAYAISKWQGEQQALEAARPSPMQLVVVRLPLVYGPGVRANFLRLLRWVDRGWPLPLGAVHNARSLVSLWNLSDLLLRLLEHRAAAGTWMVSDGADLSTPQLLREMGHALGKPVRLLTVPLPLLRAAARLSGRAPEVARLCGSLTVDVAATCAALDWKPPISVQESLTRTAAWYRSGHVSGQA
jgi:nucleoside-diphosphate-sugar epimerase